MSGIVPNSSVRPSAAPMPGGGDPLSVFIRWWEEEQRQFTLVTLTTPTSVASATLTTSQQQGAPTARSWEFHPFDPLALDGPSTTTHHQVADRTDSVAAAALNPPSRQRKPRKPTRRQPYEPFSQVETDTVINLANDPSYLISRFNSKQEKYTAINATKIAGVVNKKVIRVAHKIYHLQRLGFLPKCPVSQKSF